MSEENNNHGVNPHPFRPKHLTIAEIREGCRYIDGDDGIETRICAINEEFRQGFDILKEHKEHNKSVTFWGGTRLVEGDKYYEIARNLGRKIGAFGYTIVTGGGPGIMEAGNRGAFEVGAHSIGATIVLPYEQATNPYVKEEIPFYFFFTRKVILAYSAEVYLYFPGGFGTFDELFEILTLIQTKKIPRVPVVLVGSEFWKPLDEFIRREMLEKHKTVDEEDLALYQILDDEDAIMKIVHDAPTRAE